MLNAADNDPGIGVRGDFSGDCKNGALLGRLWSVAGWIASGKGCLSGIRAGSVCGARQAGPGQKAG